MGFVEAKQVRYPTPISQVPTPPPSAVRIPNVALIHHQWTNSPRRQHNADLFAVAGLILIPLNPTPADLRALVKGLPLVRQSGKPSSFVLARVRRNLKNNDGAALALEALGLVLPSPMHVRVIYAETFAHGKTALEIDPKGVAVQEVAALWQAVKARLEENENA